MVDSEDTVRLDANEKQLGLSSFFWLTASLALLLTYAQKLGPLTIQQLIVDSCCVVLAASFTSIWTKRWTESFYWSALYALLGFLAVAGSAMVNSSIAIGWGAVGACCGAIVGARTPRNLWLGMAVSGLLGFLAMAITLVVLRETKSPLVLLDVVGAFFVGAGLKPLTEVLRWAENRSGKHRVVLASWLAISVVVGNFLVPILAGVQR